MLASTITDCDVVIFHTLWSERPQESPVPYPTDRHNNRVRVLRMHMGEVA